MQGVADDTRDAALDAARHPGRSPGDWLDAVVSERAAQPPSAVRRDHSAEMEAIAAQLARLSGDGDRTAGRRDPAGADARAAIRDAVAAISRRQADLDAHGGDASPPSARSEVPRAQRFQTSPARAAEEPVPPGSKGTSAQSEVPGATPLSRAVPPSTAPSPFATEARDPAGLRRSGSDLSAEVSQTFARFSRDLQDAIQSTDVRPNVEALDRQIRQIGHAVDGLGAGLPDADAIARIGEQTREMRDILRASSGRPVALDAVERQVASLEARLGRLAELPVSTVAGAPAADFSDTMAEVRALLDGLTPGTTMAALETRLDDITHRIERGLDAQGPVGLIEGLSRRVDEIHASLHSQLAASAVDTRPLEGLVRGLSERIGQAREASTDIQQLEIAMRDVAARIDGAAGIDRPGVQAVEAQLARLADRLDRSESSQHALDGVEQTLGELFSQFEVTRQVAIDAAETAARTAARDTLRAALQNPSLTPHSPEMSPALADQMARGLDDLRTQQDQAQLRTQSALSDIQAAMERLRRQIAGEDVGAPPPPSVDEPRRRRSSRQASPAEAPRVTRDHGDMLIEPGLGRSPAGRTEPQFAPEPEVDAGPGAAALDGDGPASFIAAARRAAQAAQASAAATALKTVERRPAGHAPTSRDRVVATAAGGTLARARQFLMQRRRPILLSLAALVLLVGALEVVKLSVEPVDASRAGASDAAAPSRTRLADAAAPTIAATASPTQPAALLPPVAAPARPPLPTFVAGPAKTPAPVDGIGEGLRSLAAAGDPAAQFEVGLRYAEGRGMARDAKQAVAWFSKAAAQGSAPAQYRLGSAYEKGVGVDRDPALAMSWYGKAADAGNIRAMHNLAVMSAEGASGKPDYAKAAQWFGKASTYGVRDSQFNLAILYARGLGIEQSLGQSYTWFAIAAAEGDADSAKKRDEVAGKLDPQALAAAKSAADAYRAAVAPAAANEVAAPAGGWDAAAARAPLGASPAVGAKVSQL